MITFVASFIIFLLFVLALSLSLIFRKKPLVSEEEATANILGDVACASCQQMCAMAGRNISAKAKKKVKCTLNDVEIPHQDV